MRNTLGTAGADAVRRATLVVPPLSGRSCSAALGVPAPDARRHAGLQRIDSWRSPWRLRFPGPGRARLVFRVCAATTVGSPCGRTTPLPSARSIGSLCDRRDCSAARRNTCRLARMVAATRRATLLRHARTATTTDTSLAVHSDRQRSRRSWSAAFDSAGGMPECSREVRQFCCVPNKRIERTPRALS